MGSSVAVAAADAAAAAEGGWSLPLASPATEGLEIIMTNDEKVQK